MFTADNLTLEDLALAGHVGAVALIACRISQSFRMHATLGGVSMSQATLVHLCRLAALEGDTAPQHHVRLVHFLADRPTGQVANAAGGDLG